jgi:hypothetical protein
MNREELFSMADKSHLDVYGLGTNYAKFADALERFAALVASAEREACADIADRLPRIYRETKEAHERATLEPFIPSKFGFDFAELRQAEAITHAIRARDTQ